MENWEVVDLMMLWMAKEPTGNLEQRERTASCHSLSQTQTQTDRDRERERESTHFSMRASQFCCTKSQASSEPAKPPLTAPMIRGSSVVWTIPPRSPSIRMLNTDQRPQYQRAPGAALTGGLCQEAAVRRSVLTD